MDQIHLASTDDPVARAQAGRVRALLEARTEPLAVVWMVFESSTDPAEQIVNLSRKLVEREIDVAAYPAERLPAHLPPGVRLGAVVRDLGAHYCCLSSGHPVLSAMPQGSRIVTCDPVARAQLLHRFPAFTVDMASLCGGVIDGMRRHEWDAAVVPASILESGPLTGLRYESVPFEEVMPAVGLGIVAVIERAGESRMHGFVGPLDEKETRILLHAERAFLLEIPPNPDILAAARARQSGDVIEVSGLVVDRNGRWLVRDQAWAPARFADIIAREVAESCADMARERLSRPPGVQKVASL